MEIKELDEIKNSIEEFLNREILFSQNAFPYAADESLIGAGVIDSMGVLELVTFVQNTFGIAVDAADVTQANFDSVARIAAYVRRKI